MFPPVATQKRKQKSRIAGFYITSHRMLSELDVQALLTARWPLEMQQHRHSCIQQIQDIYKSSKGLPRLASQECSTWAPESKWADGTQEIFLDLSQVLFCCRASMVYSEIRWLSVGRHWLTVLCA